MGRPPSNGGPAFRFNATEVAEMETILHEHNTQVPAREVLQALADKFSLTPERSGKIEVQMKQVWNWFQNRRYAIRAKASRTPAKYVSTSLREDPTAVRNMTQVPQHVYVPAGGIAAVQSAGSTQPDNAQMEFEAKSARDGAWYDVTSFLSHKSVETGDPHVLVRFAGFGPEEDEWVNVRKHVRQRSLPCESAECVAVLPGDLILCFQEGKEQALYYDAHVLDAQRRRHDMRGCRCRFLVRYDHDQSEEIVPLKKVCRRPDTDHRLQQLHAMKESGSMNQQKTSLDPHSGNTLRVYPPSEPMQKLQTIEERAGTAAVRLPISHGNTSAATDSKAMQPENIDVRGGGNAQLEVSQPESAEPSSVGKVETTVVHPSNVALPSNAETSKIAPDNADLNMGATTSTVAIANPESSEMTIGATTGTVTGTNAETSIPTQDDSAMNIEATANNVETTMADTSMVPPANSDANTSAETLMPSPADTDKNIDVTMSAVPNDNAEMSAVPPAGSAMDVDDANKSTDTDIAETSVVPPVNIDATTSTTVPTVNAEASVVPSVDFGVDVGADTSSVAPGTTVETSVVGGEATAASGIDSDQNMVEG